jgi:hypothetical protein
MIAASAATIATAPIIMRIVTPARCFRMGLGLILGYAVLSELFSISQRVKREGHARPYLVRRSN